MKTDNQIIITFPAEKTLAHQLKIAAARLNISRSELLRQVVIKYLESAENESDYSTGFIVPPLDSSTFNKITYDGPKVDFFSRKMR